MSQLPDDHRADANDGGTIHPPADKLRAYGVGAIDPREAETIEEHLENCDSCVEAVAVAEGDRLVALIREAARTESDGPMRLVAGYHIEQEIGRGGMGVVYQARQSTLRRLVALKVIDRLGDLGPSVLRRFHTEATALAKLDHPNIVKVYDVGEQDGRPFIAMELVRGSTLAKVLRQGPLQPKVAAELAAVLARAVQHAHDRGVLHRDLKPANVLLSHQDGTAPEAGSQEPAPIGAASARLVDFGLAKQLDADLGRTQTGEILGTPRYMAPEQIDGVPERVGPAVDVYGLGAVLYETLVGRPPFQAATTLETLELVRDSEVVSPKRLLPSLSKDLDVICLKCLAKNPAQRYASAAALADDLQRFLAGQPIVARPIPWWRRLGRLIRRHPALSASLAISVAALMTLLLVGAVYNSRLRTAIDNVRQEKERADKNFAHSFSAVDRMLERVGFSNLADVPEMETTRLELLEDAVELYGELLKNQPKDGAGLESERRYAFALTRLGQVQYALGQPKKALARLEEALRRQRELAKRFPEDIQTVRTLAITREHLADVSLELGDRERAVKELRAEIESVKPLIKEHPDLRFELARALNRLASCTLAADEASRLRQQAIDEWLQVAKAQPTNPEVRHSVAETQYNMALLDHRSQRHVKAEKRYLIALAKLEELVREHPSVAGYTASLAECYTSLGALMMETGRDAEGEAMMRRGLEQRKLLAKRFPHTLRYQNALARSYTTLGGKLISAGDGVKASVELLEALRIHGENAKKSPSAFADAAYAEVLVNLATSYQQQGKPDEAAKRFDEAVAVLRRVVDTQPKETRFRISLGICCLNYSNQLRAEDPESALSLNDEAVSEFQAAARLIGIGPLRTELLMAHGARAQSLMALQRFGEAVDAWDEVLHYAPAAARDQYRITRSLTLVYAGRYREAVADIDDLLLSEHAGGEATYNMACILALAAKAAGADAEIPKQQRLELRKALIRKSLELLKRDAIGKYVASPQVLQHVQRDPDLEDVRKEPEFAELLEDWRAVRVKPGGNERCSIRQLGMCRSPV